MLEYNINQIDEGEIRINFTGKIEDKISVPLTKLTCEIEDAKVIHFNFSQVHNMDSLGIRRWVMFLRELEVGRKLYFEDCTTDIINQINITPAFLGHAVVSSFYTKYLCTKCDATELILAKTADVPVDSYPEPPLCKTCREPMETEELESEYFHFLSRTPR